MSETTDNVLTCPGAKIQRKELAKIITDWERLHRGRPNHAGTLLTGINQWRGEHGYVTACNITHTLKAAFEKPTSIGWCIGFKGFL